MPKRSLIVAATALDLAGGTAVAIVDWPGRLFFLGLLAIEVGTLALLILYVSQGRQSVEAAFDMGVEVGERRGLRKARPVVVPLNAARPIELVGQRGR